MPHPIKLPLRAAALVAAVLSLPAFAAGLGELSLRSHLGQPFRAEIDLVALDPAEREQLHARLATVEAHQRANVEFAPALQSLRVTLGQRAGGQPFVRIVSHAPINEPFLRFLVELGTQSGRITREYTVLLDPPNPVRADVAVELPGADVAGTALPRPARAERKPSAPATRTAESASTQPLYVVQPGDSLSRIALEQQHDGVNLHRMMIALHRANPAAFIEGNIDRLIAGRALRIPSADEVNAIAQGEGASNPHELQQAASRSGAGAQATLTAPSPVPSVDAARAAPDTDIRSSRLERLEPPPKPAAARDRLSLAPPPGRPDPGAEAADRLVQRQRARVFELENRMDELLSTLKQANERIAQLNRELDTVASRRVAAVEAPAQPSARTPESAPPRSNAPASTAVESTASGPSVVDRARELVPPALVVPPGKADAALQTFAEQARGRFVPIVASLVVLLGLLLVLVRWWLRSRVTAADDQAVYSSAAIEAMLESQKQEDHWQPLAPDAAEAMVTAEVDLNIGDVPAVVAAPAAAAVDHAEAPVAPPQDDGLSALGNWSARLMRARRGAATGRGRTSR